jgi:hypothetical protein
LQTISCDTEATGRRQEYRIQCRGRGGIETNPKDEVGESIEFIFFGETLPSGVAAAENKGSEMRLATRVTAAITRMTLRS